MNYPYKFIQLKTYPPGWWMEPSYSPLIHHTFTALVDKFGGNLQKIFILNPTFLIYLETLVDGRVEKSQQCDHWAPSEVVPRLPTFIPLAFSTAFFWDNPRVSII
jgi:hypothetical protein